MPDVEDEDMLLFLTSFSVEVDEPEVFILVVLTEV